jgi:hypothetical protein
MQAPRRFAGWSKDDLRETVIDLLRVLAKAPRWDLVGFSCTIDLRGYERAKAQIISLKQPIGICLDHCMGVVFQRQRDGTKVELWFDRGEEISELLSLWRGVAGKRAIWAQSVSMIDEVSDMREHPPLQAADLLAWTTNRYYTKGSEDPHGGRFAVLFLLKDLIHTCFRQQDLLQVFDSNGSYRTNVKIPVPRISFPKGTMLARGSLPPPRSLSSKDPAQDRGADH